MIFYWIFRYELYTNTEPPQGPIEGLGADGTMCTRSACTILGDNFLSTGFLMAHEIGHVYVFEFNLNMIFILQDFCLNWRNKSVNNNLSKCNLCYIVLFRLGCYHDEDSHCSEYPKFDGPTIIVIGIGQLVHSIISVIFWSKILLKLTFAINIFEETICLFCSVFFFIWWNISNVSFSHRSDRSKCLLEQDVPNMLSSFQINRKLFAVYRQCKQWLKGRFDTESIIEVMNTFLWN